MEFLKCFAIGPNLEFLMKDNRGGEPGLAHLNGVRCLMMVIFLTKEIYKKTMLIVNTVLDYSFAHVCLYPFHYSLLLLIH